MSRLQQLMTAANEAVKAVSVEARAAWPVGAEVIVRNQRYGYAPTEFRASVVGVGLSVWTHGREAHTSIQVNVRNLATGKTSTRYPGIEVAGLPQVRLAHPDEQANSHGAGVSE